MTLFLNILQSLKRGALQLVHRPPLLFMMIAMPVLCAWFLLDLMKAGTIDSVPVAIVNLDNSAMSRSLDRNLSALQGIKVTTHYATHEQAMKALQRGDIQGFFFIPARLQELTLAGQKPVVSYYINYAYFSPSSAQYKGFKTVSMLANGAIAKTTLDATGLANEQMVDATLQPILTHVHGIANPWSNYSYYLNISFIPCLLALFILLTTATTIGYEFKQETSVEWLDTAGGSIIVATLGKLLPQTCIFTATGWTLQWIMFAIYGLPLNCNPLNMIWAMAIFVPACQGFGLFIMCFLPNYRYGGTVCTLLGMLSFSFCGFSMPIESMYPWVTALGNVVPVRHFFVISVDQALNGIDIYYSRLQYAILLCYVLLPLPLLLRLRHNCKHPVYVP